MAYIKTNWVNNETELNAQNMNHIEDGIEGAYGIPLLAVTDTAPAECEAGDKYYDETTGKIYTATGHNTWGTTGEDPEEGSFYIVFATQNVYTYDGQDLVSVGGGAGGQIAISETEPTEDEILWINPEDTPAGSLNPITNTYSEATDKGYSCEYLNNNDSYSTTEVKTNKRWIDGKPIYRKCFEVLKSQTSSSSINITHNISNVGTLISQQGTLLRTDGVQHTIPNGQVQNADYATFYSDFDSTTIRVRMGSALYNAMNKLCVMVEYTKTTD